MIARDAAPYPRLASPTRRKRQNLVRRLRAARELADQQAATARFLARRPVPRAVTKLPLAAYQSSLRHAANRFAAHPTSRVVDLRLALSELAAVAQVKLRAGNKVTSPTNIPAARMAVVMRALAAADDPTNIPAALRACDTYEHALTRAADQRPDRLLDPNVLPCEPEPFHLKTVPLHALDWQTHPPMGLPPDAVALGHEQRRELARALDAAERNRNSGDKPKSRLERAVREFTPRTVKSTISALRTR